MLKKTFFFLLLFFVLVPQFRADEGMWIPLLLEGYTIEDMHKKGLKLSAEEIYSVNKASLKDAVPIFGGGCTSAVVSDQGLLFTNHHCGYGQIQSHSSLEHDYLTDGFWAMSQEEELPNPGLKVRFLVRIEDVTDKVLETTSPDMEEGLRNQIIQAKIEEIKAEATKDTHYESRVVPFFAGNQYFLFVTEVFKDVRLVGAPPSAIGKFGGDTDNWMWPRHTGDFSVFRIYANKDNEPAEYSPDNIPYQPKKHFTISLKGVEKGDFTMVYGYPGSTQQYLTSYAVDLTQNTSNPHKIKIRRSIIDIMRQAMEADPKVRIQYASKYARVSNYWKKWKGENKGLQRLNAIQKKQNLEENFIKWINKDEDRKQQYAHLLPEYEKLYKEFSPIQLAIDYLNEAAFGPEIVGFASHFKSLAKVDKETDQDKIDKMVADVLKKSKGFYKDYYLPVDKRVFEAVMNLYYQNIPEKHQPAIFRWVEKKFDGDMEKYTDYVFSESKLVNEKKLKKFLDDFKWRDAKKIEKDPAFVLYNDIINVFVNVLRSDYYRINNQISRLDRDYIRGLREFKKNKRFYPDANFTLRVAYGNVEGYRPRDGVKYIHYTTIDGIIAKDNPDIYDYRVPEKLKELHAAQDYGQYAKDGQLYVCFLATNHTTGGNSGSPVINAEGELIGMNFDRCWEGTMSDIMFDPDMCRNITLDIRYALFIIDKFAGANHLINEMDIVK